MWTHKHTVIEDDGYPLKSGMRRMFLKGEQGTGRTRVKADIGLPKCSSVVVSRPMLQDISRPRGPHVRCAFPLRFRTFDVLDKLLPELLLFFKVGACYKRSDLQREQLHHNQMRDALEDLCKVWISQSRAL